MENSIKPYVSLMWRGLIILKIKNVVLDKCINDEISIAGPNQTGTGAICLSCYSSLPQPAEYLCSKCGYPLCGPGNYLYFLSLKARLLYNQGRAVFPTVRNGYLLLLFRISMLEISYWFQTLQDYLKSWALLRRQSKSIIFTEKQYVYFWFVSYGMLEFLCQIFALKYIH